MTGPITATLSIAMVRSLWRLVECDHYFVAAYDSIERWNQHVVVVVPDLTQPVFILTRGGRVPRRRNIMAVAIPSLEHLTLAMGQQITGVRTDYIAVRDWSEAHRRAGTWKPGNLVNTLNGR